jgi:hypothetical protein
MLNIGGIQAIVFTGELGHNRVEVNTAKNIATNIPFLCHQRDARIIGI